jgi:hypothetical protein
MVAKPESNYDLDQGISESTPLRSVRRGSLCTYSGDSFNAA